MQPPRRFNTEIAISYCYYDDRQQRLKEHLDNFNFEIMIKVNTRQRIGEFPSKSSPPGARTPVMLPPLSILMIPLWFLHKIPALNLFVIVVFISLVSA